MKAKSISKNAEFKQRSREVFQAARQTMTVAIEYFSSEEEEYLDRLIAINNQNNFKKTLEEINNILRELCFKAKVEDGKSETMIASLKVRDNKIAFPELHVAIIRSLCFKAMIHATEYMLSKNPRSSMERNESSLTNAYMLLREIEEII